MTNAIQYVACIVQRGCHIEDTCIQARLYAARIRAGGYCRTTAAVIAIDCILYSVFFIILHYISHNKINANTGIINEQMD